MWHTTAMSVHICTGKISIILHYLSLKSLCLSQLIPQRELFHMPVSVPAFSSCANRWHTREHFWRVPTEAAFQTHYTHNHTTAGEQTEQIYSKSPENKNVSSECDIWRNQCVITPSYICLQHALISSCFMPYNLQMGQDSTTSDMVLQVNCQAPATRCILTCGAATKTRN